MDRLIYAAIDGFPAAWYSPTYKSLTEVWRTLTDVLADVTQRRSEQEHRLDLIGDGTIDMWSLEDPHGSRGRKYKRVIINEAASVARLEEAWEQAIRPTLTDYQGDAWFLSTPRGFNFFKALYDRAETHPDWRAWTFPTGANPHIPAAEIAAAEADSPKRTFAQEYLASFVASGGCLFEMDMILAQRAAARRPIEICQNGALVYWQRQIIGRQYVIGADVAEGKDAGNDSMDYSVAIVLDWQTGLHVATLRGQWAPDVFAELLAALGKQYNTALLGVERNNDGKTVLLKLRELGYDNIYQHDDPIAALSNRPATTRKIAGWPTTQQTKPILETELGAAIRAQSICSWDTGLWDECLSYVRHPNGKTGAEANCHDDRVLAAMIAWEMRKHARAPGDAGGIVVGRVQVRR